MDAFDISPYPVPTAGPTNMKLRESATLIFGCLVLVYTYKTDSVYRCFANVAGVFVDIYIFSLSFILHIR